MSAANPHHTPGRDGHAPSRPRGGRRLAGLALAVAVASGLVGAAAYASSQGGATGEPRNGEDLRLDWQARSGGVQVLGGTRDPGTPSVQRIRHDEVDFTVTVAPARPGPNLVRVDAARISKDGVLRAHGAHGTSGRHRVFVGTRADFDAGRQVRAETRPGATGLWAVVDLPEGSGTILVSHGPRHLVPFAVDTGSEPAATEAWSGPDGPECATAATAAVLAGGTAADACPSEGLDDESADALRRTVDTLVDRGVEEIAVQRDASPRSAAAYDLVREVADVAGVRVVEPSAAPGARNALLVVSGWADAATSLTKVTATPLHQQPIRSDGTWLAPWLLTPGVVDSTAGAVLALDFDIRDPAAQVFSQTLVALFPGQSPTSAGYLAWREARGDDPDPLSLYAASRAAYMPNQPGHTGHGSEVAWFPGGTVTPVGGISEGTP